MGQPFNGLTTYGGRLTRAKPGHYTNEQSTSSPLDPRVREDDVALGRQTALVGTRIGQARSTATAEAEDDDEDEWDG